MIRLQIVLGRGSYELSLTLLGTKLITYDGDAPVEQEFDTVAQIVDHVQRVIQLRQRAGYRVIAERKDDAIVMPPDPKAQREGEEWEAQARRLTETYDDAADPAVECGAILDRAGALRARALRVVVRREGPGAAWSAALRERPMPAITAFVFDDRGRPRAASCGAIDDLLAGLPNLERLCITGEVEPAPMRHASLRELRLSGDPLPAEVLEPLGASALPALETLALDLAIDTADEPATAAQVATAVHGLAAPRLASLSITGADDVTALLEQFAVGRPIANVAFAGSIPDGDAFVAAVQRAAPWLARCARVALPLEDELAPEQVAACKAAAPKLVDLSNAAAPVDVFASW